MPVNVFLTVDTEHIIVGAFADQHLQPVGNDRRIYGRIDGNEYGIPLIMDIADRNSLPITFFVEVFNQHFFGSSETAEVVRYISGRNHDVQLHLHPNYLNFNLARPQDLKYSDFIGDYSLDEQVKMITAAKQMLIESGAKTPVAFRAGCFGANEDTLKALNINNILIDSSYNQSFLGSSCLLPDWGLNDISSKEGIFELPVTNFIENSGLRSRRCMPLDINGVSFEEMRHVLSAALEKKAPQNITVILHSFSFIKAKDVQYSQTRIRNHVIHRFTKLCTFLAENNSDYTTRSLGELTRSELRSLAQYRSDSMPKVPAHLSMMRYFGQLWDNLL